MQVLVPVSIGELVDKITILQIKASRFEGQAQAQAHVQQGQFLLQAFTTTAWLSWQYRCGMGFRFDRPSGPAARAGHVNWHPAHQPKGTTGLSPATLVRPRRHEPENQ